MGSYLPAPRGGKRVAIRGRTRPSPDPISLPRPPRGHSPASGAGSIVELELLGVNERPEDVLVSLLHLVLARCDVVQRRGLFAARRRATEGSPEDALDLLEVRSFVLGQRL